MPHSSPPSSPISAHAYTTPIPLTAATPNPTSTTAMTTQAYAIPTRGLIDLPIVGTKGAPKKFKGQPSEVEHFLKHYEKLCDKYGVRTDADKVIGITQYCSRQVREFLEGLASYTNQTWTNFERDFKEFFNADRDDRRFRVKDLEKYVSEMRKKPTIKDLGAWRKYSRGYIRIGGWLKQHQKISNEEYNTYFWKGVPHRFRDRLEQRLMGQTPTHDITKPFESSDVEKVAKSMLQRDRFDRERLPSDDESDSDEHFDSSDSSDSGDSESDYSELDKFSWKKRKSTHSSKDHRNHRKDKEKKKPKKKFRSDIESDSDNTDEEDTKSKDHRSHKKDKKKLKKKLRFASDNESESDDTDDEDTKPHHKNKSTPKKALSDNDAEVERLIDQLSRMSVSDPGYASIYFRACNMHPMVQQIVARPIFGRGRGPPSGYPPLAPSIPAPSGMTRDLPPHMNQQPFAGPRSTQCYGCGESGHGIPACPKLLDLEKRKVVRRNSQGRWEMYDGSRIYRQVPFEPLATAATRMQAQVSPQANFISVPQATLEEITDEEMNEAYPVRPVSHAVLHRDDSSSDGYSSADELVFAADRPERTIRNARKKFEGVWVKPHNPETARRKTPDNRPRKVPNKENSPEPMKVGPPRKSVQTPVEVRKPIVIDANDSDQFMNDEFEKPKPRKPLTDKKSAPEPKSKAPATDKEGDGGRERHARMSDLQSKVKVENILEKVFRAPVTMEVGELLGTSKEMAHQVQEALKPRSTTTARSTPKAKAYLTGRHDESFVVASASFAPRSKGSLIKLKMECDGIPIEAIIDTGSQLNIANRSIWKKSFSRPMDITKKIIMNDANGGTGLLTGFVPNVPFKIGDVLTYASVFVGDNAPFDLLLGRPWQRGNFISIDERLDGTYLLFKDQELHVRYEMLVTPDYASDPAIAEYIARTGAMLNLHVKTLSHPEIPSEGESDADVMVMRARTPPNFDIQEIMEMLQELQEQKISQTQDESAKESRVGTPSQIRMLTEEEEKEILKQFTTILDEPELHDDTNTTKNTDETNDSNEEMNEYEASPTNMKSTSQESVQEITSAERTRQPSAVSKNDTSYKEERKTYLERPENVHMSPQTSQTLLNLRTDETNTNDAKNLRASQIIPGIPPYDPGGTYLAEYRYWDSRYIVEPAGPFTILTPPRGLELFLPRLVIPTPIPPLPPTMQPIGRVEAISSADIRAATEAKTYHDEPQC